MRRLAGWLGERVDGITLNRARRALGLVFALSAARPLAYGWVDELYLAPSYHFAWVEWAVVPPAPALYGLFVGMVVAGLGLALGRHPRAWSAMFVVPFVYVELLDAALYLNHYVLLTLLAAAFAVIPPGPRAPRWALLGLQLLFASVWVWAGLAKVDADWLLRGEPLRTWLAATADWPWVGAWLAWAPTALVMSWGGMLYDLTLPVWLWWPRARPLALAAAIGFHVAVWLLFPIGVFPWLMIPGAFLFCADALGPGEPGPPMRAPGLLAYATALAALVLVPARGWLEEGDVRWHERGHRFAWRVMLIEKTGLVDYRVVERGTGQTWRVRPSDELRPWQHEQMRTQPDLIAQYGRHLAQRFAARGHDVAVYADAFASLHGSPVRRLLPPDLDLSGRRCDRRSVSPSDSPH